MNEDIKGMWAAIRDDQYADQFDLAQAGDALFEALELAEAAAIDAGARCPSCGKGWAVRVTDKNGPNSMWECPKCKEGYYTHSDSLAHTYLTIRDEYKRLKKEHDAPKGPPAIETFCYQCGQPVVSGFCLCSTRTTE